ncbi:MAG: hypothetical protein ACI4TK_02760 [Agathobacter sp.]
MYHEVFEICKNTKRVMNMFSEELRILDRNTVQYMIDEMQEEINQKNALLEQKDAQIEQKDAQIELLKKQIEELKK